MEKNVQNYTNASPTLRLDLYKAEAACSSNENYILANKLLTEAGAIISFFGSSRTPSDHLYYSLTEQLAKRLSDDGYSICSGGGPGIMEAANKGAFYGNGLSIGLNIKLPREQHPNPYQNIQLHFNEFLMRKKMFMQYSSAFVVMPGGIGTLDEFYELFNLLKTGKMPATIPVIFIGCTFWNGLIEWMKNTLVEYGMSDELDMDLFVLTDDLDEAAQIIKRKIPLPTV